MTHHKPTLFPLVGAALLLAVTALSVPAAADPPLSVKVVIRSDNSYEVLAPDGFECEVKAKVLPNGQALFELECLDLALPPECGTVTAGVHLQTGDVGHTTAFAICGGTARGSCDAFLDPVTGAHDCAVSLSGSGVATCAWVTTVNVNYNRVGFCNFPLT